MSTSFTDSKNNNKNSKKKKLIFPLVTCLFLLLLTLFTVIFPTEGMADMFGFFKKYDVHLCPEVKGQILKEGKAVADTEVIRSLTYADNKERIDSVKTDNEGRFILPEVNIRSKMPGNFLVEHTTRQIIFVEDEDQKRPLWLSTHTGIKPVSTYNKKLASLNCDLTSPLVHFEFTHEYNPDRHHSAASICRWNDDFKIY